MAQKRAIILDGDPGHDDAIAWMLAAASDALQILAVTTVCGNQTVEKVSYNARRICTLLGIEAPVAAGRSTPLVSEAMNAPSVHGESGLDGPALPEPTMPLCELSSVALMAKVVSEYDGKVTIISTGPLTNTACFLLAHPELKEKLECISIMGGGIELGNWTPAAEFNILVDPEAAKVVFESGVPILMCGLDVTEKALILPQDFEAMRAIGGQVGQIVAEWLEFFYRFHKNIGYEGAPMHDPCAVAVLLRPELFDLREMCVQIETKGEYCRGATVGHNRKPPNARVAMGVDRAAFVQLLIDAADRLKNREVAI
ncbi:MAG: nucleoside hydrolase [Ruminococcaceae bacterium]|nr:nucleoside hydrolase [Oscillospiraceae bacterium]